MKTYIKLVDSLIEEAYRRIYVIRTACDLEIPVSSFEVKKVIERHWEYFDNGVYYYDHLNSKSLNIDNDNAKELEKFAFTFGMFYACVMHDHEPSKFMVS